MKDIRVVNTGSKDIDSINIDVIDNTTNEVIISGSYNQKTNWVHLDDDDIVEAIESGNLKIN